MPVDAEGREVASATAPGAVGSRRVVKLQLVHRTPVEDIPTQITAAWGRILVGVGRTLRLYDLGARRLLRKSEARGFPGPITSIAVSLDRVFVGDALETVHVVKYKHAEGSLVVFADDVATRHTTALAVLDHDTVAVRAAAAGGVERGSESWHVCPSFPCRARTSSATCSSCACPRT